jgi:hypothetical protein
MVGIHKKVKQLLNVIQKYAPLLSKFVPGLEETVGAISEVGENIADGINNVYEDYTDTKFNRRNYCVMDGFRSFARPTAIKSLTKEYGGLHPRVKLKDSENLNKKC